MILFWLTAALMLLAGYLLFVPALRGRRRVGLSRARLNLALHRQRQEELAGDAATPEALNLLTAESERHLLGDLESARPDAARNSGRGRGLLLGSLVAVPLLALAAYFGLGRPDLVANPPAAIDSATLDRAVQTLADRLRANPNDLEGWILLGRSLMTLQKTDSAAQAFGFAAKLAPGDLDLQATYAETLAEAQRGAMSGRPTEIAEEILRQDPRHKGGLWLAGLAAAERGDLPAAIRHWETLKAQFAPDSRETLELAEFIGKAEAERGAAPSPAAGSSGRRLRVRVTLAAALGDRADPEDTVFIFARAAEGPPMPLAVVRKQVRDLPVEVTLDDSLSMMPGMTLSSFERLVVGARVSKSGRPVPSPGDLEGLTEPVTPGPDARYDIAISRVVAPKP